MTIKLRVMSVIRQPSPLLPQRYGININVDATGYGESIPEISPLIISVAADNIEEALRNARPVLKKYIMEILGELEKPL